MHNIKQQSFNLVRILQTLKNISQHRLKTAFNLISNKKKVLDTIKRMMTISQMKH